MARTLSLRGVSEAAAKAARTKAIIEVVIALLYGASPIDLIPDLLGPLGLVDDALIVPTLLAMAYFQFRKARNLRAALPSR